MKDSSGTIPELIEEISVLKQRIRDLEQSELDHKLKEEALLETASKFRPLAEQSLMGVAIIQDGVFKYVNHKYAKIHGYAVDELMDKFPFLNLVHPDDMQRAGERFKNRLAGKEVCGAAEFKKVKKNGDLLDVINFGTVESFKGKPAIFSFLLDITDRKRAEKALLESELKYRSLASTADSSYLVDRDCRYLFANDNYLERFGPMRNQIIGKKFDELHDMESSAIFSERVKQVFETGNSCQDENYGRRTGRYFIRTFSPVKDTSGNVTAVTIGAKDITDRKKAEEALRESEKRYRELSMIDDLTQLYNSRHFYHQLKMEIDRVDRYGQPLTLLMLDIDDFKAFNDVYGHVEGDHALSRLGQAVKKCLRHIDSAYRYGGEEFTIILPMTKSEEGAVTAERIRTEFRKENFSTIPGKRVHLTVSIGIAQYKPPEDMKVLVHRVDQLMYQGKNGGKDRICVEQ